jgi:hypothetical protein
MPRVVQTEYVTKGANTISGINQRSANGPSQSDLAVRNNSYNPIVNRGITQEKPNIQYDPSMVVRKKSIGPAEGDAAQQIKFTEQVRPN